MIDERTIVRFAWHRHSAGLAEKVAIERRLTPITSTELLD
jgi:hypothetical protein